MYVAREVEYMVQSDMSGSAMVVYMAGLGTQRMGHKGWDKGRTSEKGNGRKENEG